MNTKKLWLSRITAFLLGQPRVKPHYRYFS